MWLREQGDWTGSQAVKEDWILLEGRACEITRAEAHCELCALQKACAEGTVRAYLQSLQRKGHAGSANARLTIMVN